MFKLILTTVLACIFSLSAFSQLYVTASYYIVQGGGCYGDVAQLYDSTFGGSGQYAYLWSPGYKVSDSTIANPTFILTDTVTTLSLRVIDIGGVPDTAYATVVINATFPLFVTGQVTGNPCSLTPSGAIILSVTGGSPPYYFSWSNGANTANIAQLTSGIYSITVTDNNGCNAFQTFIVTSGNLGVRTLIEADTCGAGNGAIVLNNYLGNPQITYLWAGGSTDSIRNGLTEGDYYLTITDGATACSLEDTITVPRICPNISGYVYEDVNQNGTFDAGDNPLSGVRIMAASGEDAYSGPGGLFNLQLFQTGTNTLTVVPPTAFACVGQFSYLLGTPASGQRSINLTSLTQQITGQDFGLELPSNVQCGDIFGHVFKDLNSNGIQDAGEIDLSGVGVYINGNRTTTNSMGNYSMSVPLNVAVTVSLDTGFSQTSYYCSYSSSSRIIQVYPTGGQGYTVTLSSANPASTGNDFGVQTIGGYDAMMVGLNPYNTSLGDTFNVYMDYKRYGTFTTDCYLRVEFDPTYISYVSSQRAISSQGAGYIEFFFAANDPITGQCMQMSFYLDASAPPGYQLNWQAYFNCGTTDVCPQNDTITRTTTLPGTPKRGETAAFFGQTFMRAFTTSTLPDGDILATDTTFSYLYQFQNTTGDTVFHVVIKDTLPAEFQFSTVSQAFANAPFEYVLKPDGEITLTFENITLTDSAEADGNSHLFVVYNVIMQPGLLAGTEVAHRAAVYLNRATTPELTPYVVNKIVEPEDTTGVLTLSGVGSLHIYPNPASGKVILQLDGQLTEVQVGIVSMSGVRVLETTITQPTTMIDVANYPAGVYFIEATTIGGFREVTKLIITE